MASDNSHIPDIPDSAPVPLPAAAPPIDPALLLLLNTFINKYHRILMVKMTHDCGEPCDFPAPDTTGWPLSKFHKAINNFYNLCKCMLLRRNETDLWIHRMRKGAALLVIVELHCRLAVPGASMTEWNLAGVRRAVEEI
ncbi:hypothetical protein EDC01DRAFT_782614 [Geopyxis carbonaria]|nr:hypothetical protein EDC01DRAFT_782614 [Geopyxis carbonaria]